MVILCSSGTLVWLHAAEGEKEIAAINLSAVTPLDHSPR